ncbi:ATR-interacting protein [Esox lucius]|uniref:ATR interacting protein n=1 Tax=Esox lucius TaxID=8010 RepID=A0A3P8YHN6_ESOLU|nr:ATR-interacting protein [Esox lucius]XP_010873378.2 ATR-interacting protein [Esox lucius]XP_034152038.1 ATR-interacting protein [Esox lucius]
MECPPSKRLKGMSSTDPCKDPFGDDDDFTQDDLEEIDIIASQAITGNQPGPNSRRTLAEMGSVGPGQGELREPKSGVRQQSCGLARDHMVRDRDIPELPCSKTFGNIHHSKADQEHFQLLEFQQADLKKKLKEVEEEILMKNGEIQVLRDSLRLAQQDKEVQRRAQLLLEKEKRDAQSEKEKELVKKVQSLQSELHFKEAEMNEMKTKLQNTERGSKGISLHGTRNSPRASGSSALPPGLSPRQPGPSALLPAANSSPQPRTPPGGTAFISKETFGAQLPSRSTPGRTSGPAHLGDDGKQQSSGRQEVTHSDPFSTFQPSHQQGSVLLSLLLQLPLDPSSLGLCHLLCISPDALPGLLTNTCLSSGSSAGSSWSSAEPRVGSHHQNKHCGQQTRFSHYQTLALSGLNMMALASPTLNPNTAPPSPCLRSLPNAECHPSPDQASPALNNTTKSCPGAVHLLPLLDYHIGLFCQSLETIAMDGSRKGTLAGAALSGSGSSDGSLASSVEDSLGSQEEFALAALAVLKLCVGQSSEVVGALLDWSAGAEEHVPQGNNRPRSILASGLAPLLPDPPVPPSTSRPSSTLADGTREAFHDLHPLLRKLLHLSDPSFSTSAVQREVVVASSLSTLNILLERAPKTQLPRFRCVLSGSALSRCLSLASHYLVLSLSVSLLAELAHSEELAAALCSHTDLCVFLPVFQYVTSRPDRTVKDTHWSLLEVKVVRFLASLFIRKSSTWSVFVESSCQCRGELVQTLVVLLHRQWLELRARLEASNTMTQNPAWCTVPGVDLLREALMLLHWLFVNNSCFSDHCLPVLHMYDQMIPAIRDTFRRIPDLSESEDLALDEICRPDTEDTEDMDIDAGS